MDDGWVVVGGCLPGSWLVDPVCAIPSEAGPAEGGEDDLGIRGSTR